MAFVAAGRSSEPSGAQATKAPVLRNASEADAICATEYRPYLSFGGDGSTAFYACVDYYSDRLIHGDTIRLQ
jgi:hypothetical protein